MASDRDGRLSKKIWKLASRYKHLIVLAFLATFMYSVFNAATLWISASFIETIFSSSQDTNANLSKGSPNTSLTSSKIPDGSVSSSAAEDLNERLKNLTRSLVIRKDKVGTLKAVCIVLLAAFLLKNLSAYMRGVILGSMMLHIVVDIRNRLFRRLNMLQVGFYDNRKGGDLTSIAINDVAVMNRMLFSGITRLFFVPFEVTSLVIILVIISWKLTLVTTILIPVSGFLLVQIGNSIRRKSKRALEQISEVVHIIQEVVQSMRVVKAFGTEEQEEKRFERTNARFLSISLKRLRLQQLSSPLNEFIGAVIGVALLWYAGREVLAGQGLSSEDFIRFMIVLFSLFQPLRTLSGLNNMLQEGMAASERVFALIEQEPEIVDSRDAVEINEFRDSIEYDSVFFRYSRESEMVLKDVSFTIKKGEIVALVGPSGAGKSTIADLLPRFYDVSDGAVRIDGKDIRRIKLKSLRNLMGIVSQETILFNNTIASNIAYGSSGASKEKIIAAAKVANAHDFIVKMENGYETVIGDRGVKLSGGQRQRISIARAVLRNPPILILDEATSSLDTESEKQVQEALNRLMSNRTALVIAHRLSTITGSDKIIMLENGKVSCIGSHRELIASCPSYRRLHELQFADIDGHNNG